MTDLDVPALPPGVEELLADAPAVLKTRVLKMTLTALGVAEDLLENGSPQVQMQVMRTVIPTLVKSLANQKDDSELDEMRKEFAELRREIMQAGSMDATVADDGPTVDSDSPDPDLSAIPRPI